MFVPDALAGVASCGAMFGRFVGTIVSGVCQILALVLSFVHGVSFGRVMCLALGAGCCFPVCGGYNLCGLPWDIPL